MYTAKIIRRFLQFLHPNMLYVLGQDNNKILTFVHIFHTTNKMAMNKLNKSFTNSFMINKIQLTKCFPRTPRS